MTWGNALIEDVCLVKGGKRLPAGHNLTCKVTKHPYIRARDIGEGKINFSEPVYITEQTHKLISRYVVKESDVIITIVGANIGDIAYVSSSFDGANLTENAVKLSAKPKVLNPLFLKYALLPAHAKEYMQIVASGAAQGKLGLYKIKKLSIPFPPLSVQHKIASILAAYDDLIENNLKRIKLLEEMAQITYEEWFVRLRFPGHEATPINPETGLPHGWRMGIMQDLFDFKNGYAFKSGSYVQDGQHKIVTIKNVQDGSFIPDTTDTIAELPSNIKAHHHLSTGDIIMSLTGNVGRVCLVYGEKYLLNQRVAKIVPNNPADRLYVYTLLRSRGTLTQLENISNGAAQQNLSPVNASKMPAVVPTRTVLNDFNKNIGGIIDLICLKNIENNRLREARDILLPRLMTGLVDIETYDPSQFLKDAA